MVGGGSNIKVFDPFSQSSSLQVPQNINASIIRSSPGNFGGGGGYNPNVSGTHLGNVPSSAFAGDIFGHAAGGSHLTGSLAGTNTLGGVSLVAPANPFSNITTSASGFSTNPPSLSVNTPFGAPTSGNPFSQSLPNNPNPFAAGSSFSSSLVPSNTVGYSSGPASIGHVGGGSNLFAGGGNPSFSTGTSSSLFAGTASGGAPPFSSGGSTASPFGGSNFSSTGGPGSGFSSTGGAGAFNTGGPSFGTPGTGAFSSGGPTGYGNTGTGSNFSSTGGPSSGFSSTGGGGAFNTGGYGGSVSPFGPSGGNTSFGGNAQFAGANVGVSGAFNTGAGSFANPGTFGAQFPAGNPSAGSSSSNPFFNS
jgi:hypothetical protein